MCTLMENWSNIRKVQGLSLKTGKSLLALADMGLPAGFLEDTLTSSTCTTAHSSHRKSRGCTRSVKPKANVKLQKTKRKMKRKWKPILVWKAFVQSDIHEGKF